MIICMCNGLRSSSCADLAGSGRCRSLGCIYRLQGARVRCGKCLPMMQELYTTHGPNEAGAASGPAADATPSVAAQAARG